MRYTRAKSDGVSSVRTPINMATSFLDLSQLYGSSEHVARQLRTNISGKLLLDRDGNLLTDAANTLGMFNPLGPSLAQDLRKAGDPRASALTVGFSANQFRCARRRPGSLHRFCPRTQPIVRFLRAKSFRLVRRDIVSRGTKVEHRPHAKDSIPRLPTRTLGLSAGIHGVQYRCQSNSLQHVCWNDQQIRFVAKLYTDYASFNANEQ